MLAPACLAAGPASEPSIGAACPASFPVQAPASPVEREAEVARLSGLGESCHDRAVYFAYQGVLLLTLGRAQEAALALEKALLLDPELAGTQLDYAQALAQLGERDSALSLAGEVSKRPDIPLSLQSWLSEQLVAWQGSAWRMDWAIEVLGGGESNLNSAPGIQSLTLTVPGGSVLVDLAPSSRRRSGGALRTGFLGSAARSWGRGLLFFSGEVTTRNSPGQSDTNQTLVSTNAAYVHPALGGQLGLRVDRTWFWMGGESAYGSSGWSLLYELPRPISPPGCTVSLGYGVEDRDFPGATLQSGRYAGAQAWLSCRSEAWLFNLGLLDGRDRADDPARPGGDQRRDDVIFGVARKLGPDTLSLSALWGKASDRLAYSPLLGDRPRHVDRLSGRLSYEYPLTNQFSIVGYVENTSQDSNIDLFKMNNKAIYFGFKLRGL